MHRNDSNHNTLVLIALIGMVTLIGTMLVLGFGFEVIN